MAVTTYTELYTLLKNNVVYIEYNKGASDVGPSLGILGLKMTLKRDLVPDSSDSLKNHSIALAIGEWDLSGDSDGALADLPRVSIQESETSYPQWIKAYSTNYGMWINVEISNIKSVEVLGE